MLLPDGRYSGIEFKREITKTEYYVYLLVLYGVPNGKTFDLKAVHNYRDYVNSNAEIALFSADRFEMGEQYADQTWRW